MADMANAEVPAGSRLLCGLKRKYPHDPTREVYEAAKSGNAVLLGKFLQEMNASERALALKTKTSERIGELTPLLAAAKEGNLDCVKVLLSFKADIEGRAKVLSFGKYASTYFTSTPLCVAAGKGHVDVLSCLVENGADVNARTTDDNCTPLMIASKKGNLDVITLLVEHGAGVDLQDKDGDTALHYAVSGVICTCCSHYHAIHGRIAPCKCTCNQTAVFHKLLTLGASQLFNSHQLTPLLYACHKGRISVVEDLLQQLEYTDKQRIDALELLGASLAPSIVGFEYMKKGMEERFKDPSRPLLKEPMKPIEAYQNRKESQTPEELAQIDNAFAVLMEGLTIRERILGTNNIELLGPINYVAHCYDRNQYNNVFRGLHIHAMNIARHCNKSAIKHLHCLTSDIYAKFWKNVLPEENILLELLKHVVFEYEKKQKLRTKLQNRYAVSYLLECTVKLVQIVSKFKHCEESKTLHESALLQRIFCLNPQDLSGNTLLHRAVCKSRTPSGNRQHLPGFNVRGGNVFKFPCPDTVKFLLDTRFSVNVINNNGDSPLHLAVKFEPNSDQIHLLTDMLEILLDGGAHHDFVNNDGKTAMDLAQTDKARSILSEKRKLELKCISASAVKKFELAYLGLVPKTLEEYIRRH